MLMICLGLGRTEGPKPSKYTVNTNSLFTSRVKKELDEIMFPTDRLPFVWQPSAIILPVRNSDGQICVPLAPPMRPRIQPRRIFNFPEFLHYPIRCALPAHRDDLGLFIPARLNIYFSAQGEAEKKNVSAGFNTAAPTALTFTRRPAIAPEESRDTHRNPWRASAFRKVAHGSASRSARASIFHHNALF